MSNERKRTNTAKKQSKESGGNSSGSAKSDNKPKRPLSWDARDIKTYGGIRESPRSSEGRYEDRYFQDE